MDPGLPGARLVQDVVSPVSSRVPLPLEKHSDTETNRQHGNEKRKMQNPKVKRYGSGAATSNSRRTANGYMPIEDYGLIGNMRTCAMVALDGGLDYMCWPYFDSPSVFCRILDKEKGGHFTIGPSNDDLCTTKQQYLPASNILQTRYLNEEGVMNVVDFFPRPNNKSLDAEYHANVVKSDHTGNVPERSDLKKWLVRRVECMRGSVNVSVLVSSNVQSC
jgi:GH15 family glucan-1,4-alpha-glucosidase